VAESNELCEEIYTVTKLFPRDELYGPTSQIRRAVVSTPSNIAEGQARCSKKEFDHFLSQARGSLVEVETQLLLAKDLGYVTTNEATRLLGLAGEIGRLLNRLIASIKAAA
jgi:four helix bundle protein